MKPFSKPFLLLWLILFFTTEYKLKNFKERIIIVVIMVLVYVGDINNLQNFVNVSLATAAGGEDDLTRDKLSNLLTVGRAFGPLIYRLPSDASYQTLQQRCETLWDTLKQTPTLFILLVSQVKLHDTVLPEIFAGRNF